MHKIIDTSNYNKFIKKYDINSLLAKVLASGNYVFTSNNNLKEPYKIKNIIKVSSKIKKSIANGEKILVYGDFDADGICASAILVKTIKKLGGKVGYFIPNRYKNGYGIDFEMINEFVKKEYKLFISLDCGVKDKKALSLLNEKDIFTIVIDHHQLGEENPKCDLLIHTSFSFFNNVNTSAGVLSFYLSWVLLDKIDEYLLTLAGISISSDSMPLVNENKLILRKAIHNLNKYRYPNLSFLANENQKMDEKTFSFLINPKLNAVGRIATNNKVNRVVEFLLDEEKIDHTLANFIENANLKRKDLSKKALSSLLINNKKVVIEKLDILEGITGLIASSISNDTKGIACIFSKADSSGICKGSIRANPSNVDVLKILDKNQNLIGKYGGHKKAAGLSIKEENFQVLKENLNKEFLNQDFGSEKFKVIELDKEDLEYKNFLELDKLRPFGEGNKEPIFILRKIKGSTIKTSKNKKHILFNLKRDVKIAYFNNYKYENDSFYDFVFLLQKSNYFSNTVECICLDMIKSN